MMEGVILIIIMILFFGIYALFHLRGRRNESEDSTYKMLRQAEAGSTKRLFRRKTDLSKAVCVDMANISMSPDKEYFVVKNNCMESRGISAGDIIGVKMFNDKFTLEKEAKEGLILLIYLDDENFKGFKIREQGSITSDGKAYHTYHYSRGVKTLSSRPHAIEDIKGVVVEVFKKEYIESAA